LFQVSDGKLKSVAELVSAKSGIEWIAISYELRKAVILPRDGPLVVVDLDRAQVVKTCEHPEVPDTFLISQWLANVPGRGAAFQWHVSDQGLREEVVQSMSLDPSLTCEQSFQRVDPGEIRYITAHGLAGVAAVISRDGTYANINPNGDVTSNLAKAIVKYDWKPIPPSVGKGGSFAGLVVNIPKFVLIVTQDKAPKNSRAFLFRKRDRTWHRIAVVGDQFYPRGFGNFLVQLESSAKRNDRSPGSDEWRKNGKQAWS
jgi:hypothetical protein